MTTRSPTYTTTEETKMRYIVKSPQEMQGRENVGEYGQQYGWVVFDAAWTGPMSSPYVASGGKREMRAYCRALNAER